MNSHFIYRACPARRGSGCTLQVRQHTPDSYRGSLASGFSLPSLTLFLVFFHFNLLAQKELSFTDKAYEPQIKTVQLYPDSDNPQDFLQPSSTSIQQQTLVLEFDDLQDNRNN